MRCRSVFNVNVHIPELLRVKLALLGDGPYSDLLTWFWFGSHMNKLRLENHKPVTFNF